MISYDTFINNNLGKPVEREDPTAKDQCMDWAFAYLDDVLGIDRATIRHQYAYQVWTNATDLTKQYFDLIPNTPTGVPQKGDLVIFGTGVGPAGHICIADGNVDGTNTFQSTDQNWNGHLYIEYIWHNYNSCLGWLRPKTQIKSQVSVDADKFAELVAKSTKYDEFVAAGYDNVDKVKADLQAKQTTNDNLNQQINDRNNDIVQLNGQISTLKTQVTSAEQKADTLESQAKQLPDLLKQNELLSDKVKNYQEAEKTWNRSKAQLESQIADIKKNSLKTLIINFFEKMTNIWNKSS